MEKGKVLIFRGGWDGHEPKQVSARFARIMEKHGYSCRIYDDQEALKDLELVMAQDLIIPCWTRPFSSSKLKMVPMSSSSPATPQRRFPSPVTAIQRTGPWAAAFP